MNEIHGYFGKWTEKPAKFINWSRLQPILKADPAKLKSWITEQDLHNEFSPKFFGSVCFPKMGGQWNRENTTTGDIPALILSTDPLELEIVGRVRVIEDRSDRENEVHMLCLAVVNAHEDEVIGALTQSIEDT